MRWHTSPTPTYLTYGWWVSKDSDGDPTVGKRVRYLASELSDNVGDTRRR